MKRNALKLISHREPFTAQDKKYLFSGNDLTNTAQAACEKLFIDPESLKSK